MGIASRMVKTVEEHSGMCHNFVNNMVKNHPELRRSTTRVCLIVENNNGPWPVSGFLRDLTEALKREAPAATIFCMFKEVQKRNEETRLMEKHILYGTHTSNASKVRGVQYTRAALFCKSIRFHANFFSDGVGPMDAAAAARAHKMFFEQLARFAPSKVTMRNGTAKSVSYSGVKADGVKADDICMAWIVFFVASIGMFDEQRYKALGLVFPRDVPSLIFDIHTHMRKYTGPIDFTSA